MLLIITRTRDSEHIYVYIVWFESWIDPLCDHIARVHTRLQECSLTQQNFNHTHQTFWLFWERKERNTNKESFHYWKQTIMRCQCPTWLLINASLTFSLSFFFFLMHVQLSRLNFQQLMLCNLYPLTVSRANR